MLKVRTLRRKGKLGNEKGKEAVSPRQLLIFLLGKEAAHPRQAVRQALSFPIGKEAVLPRQLLTFLLGKDNPTTTVPSRLPPGSSNKEPNPKWVINISNKPLTPFQRSVLAKGPNFAVSPRQPPNLEYINAIEATCTKLSQQDPLTPQT